MRVGLIGDIHQEDIALGMILEGLASMEVDQIWHVGDLADGEGSLDKTCQLLETAGVKGIAGNHDRWLVEERHRSEEEARSFAPETTVYFLGLPATRVCRRDGKKILHCHGIGEDDMARFEFDTPEEDLAEQPAFRKVLAEYNVVVFGHVHQVFSRTVGGVTFINPGTIHRSHIPGTLVWDTESDELRHYFLTAKGLIEHRMWSLHEDLLLPSRRSDFSV